MENWFMPERLAAIRRAIASEVMLCAPVTIAMLAAATAITLADLGTPTVPMTTVKLPVVTIELPEPERRITGTLS